MLDIPRTWRFLTLAGRLATEVDDHQMNATVLAMRGYTGYTRGDFGIALEYGALIEADPRVTPGSRALAAQQKARVYATFGRRDDCERDLDRAEAHLSRASAHTEDEPPWLYYYSPAHLRLQRGRAYHLLGRHTEAADLLHSGLSVLPAHTWTAPYRTILTAIRLPGRC